MLPVSELNYKGDWYLLSAKFTKDSNFFVLEVGRRRHIYGTIRVLWVTERLMDRSTDWLTNWLILQAGRRQVRSLLTVCDIDVFVSCIGHTLYLSLSIWAYLCNRHYYCAKHYAKYQLNCPTVCFHVTVCRWRRFTSDDHAFQYM